MIIFALYIPQVFKVSLSPPVDKQSIHKSVIPEHYSAMRLAMNCFYFSNAKHILCKRLLHVVQDTSRIRAYLLNYLFFLSVFYLKFGKYTCKNVT